MSIITEGLCVLIIEEIIGGAVENDAEFFDIGEVDFFYFVVDELGGGVLGESVTAQKGERTVDVF